MCGHKGYHRDTASTARNQSTRGRLRSPAEKQAKERKNERGREGEREKGERGRHKNRERKTRARIAHHSCYFWQHYAQRNKWKTSFPPSSSFVLPPFPLFPLPLLLPRWFPSVFSWTAKKRKTDWHAKPATKASRRDLQLRRSANVDGSANCICASPRAKKKKKVRSLFPDSRTEHLKSQSMGFIKWHRCH